MADSQPTTNRQKQQRFPCPTCGADLVFDPKENCLVCPYCGHKEAIHKSDSQIEERSFQQYLRPGSGQLSKVAENAIEVSCTRCGATVTFTPPDVAGACPFCGSTIVAQPRAGDPDRKS